jgi:hypothetical protein
LDKIYSQSAKNCHCIRAAFAVTSHLGNEIVEINQGFAVMKVKPASMPASKKTSARAVKSPLKKIVAAAETSSAKPKSKSAAKSEQKTEVTAETLVRRNYTRRKKTEAPSILLEGDSPAAPPVERAGSKNTRSVRRRLRKISAPRPNCPNLTARKNFSSPRATRTGFTRTGI